MRARMSTATEMSASRVSHGMRCELRIVSRTSIVTRWSNHSTRALRMQFSRYVTREVSAWICWASSLPGCAEGGGGGSVNAAAVAETGSVEVSGSVVWLRRSAGIVAAATVPAMGVSHMRSAIVSGGIDSAAALFLRAVPSGRRLADIVAVMAAFILLSTGSGRGRVVSSSVAAAGGRAHRSRSWSLRLVTSMWY